MSSARPQGYFSALDGLRALSVAAVFTWHLPGNPWAALNGFRGVSVFFVLSGYLITTLADREEATFGRLAIRPFYIRRLFRILPLYYLVLVVYLVVISLTGDGTETSRFREALPYYALYLQEVPAVIGIDNAPFELSWSLGIEEKFYLLWPLLGFAVVKQRRAARVMVALGGVVALVLVSALASGGALAALTFPYVFILIGCAAAALRACSLPSAAVAEGLRRCALPALLSLGAATVLFGDGLVWSVLFGLLAAVTVAGLAQGESLASTILSHEWLLYLGRLSYAFYLTHVLVISIVNRAVPKGDAVARGVVVGVSAFVATCVLAAVLHRWIEKPLIAKGRVIAARYRTAESGV